MSFTMHNLSDGIHITPLPVSKARARKSAAKRASNDVVEKAAPWHDSDPVKVQRFRYSDIPRAEEAYHDAFAGDLFSHYLHDTPDAKHHWLEEPLARLMTMLEFGIITDRGIAITVNHGDSFVAGDPAPNSPEGRRPPNWKTRLFTKMYRYCDKFNKKYLLSPEQNKRQQELMDKLIPVFRDLFGEQIKEMIHIGLVLTAPECQGRGYATALIHTVFAKADAEGRLTFLNATPAGEPLYKYLGFEVVGSFLMGDNNPTWDEPPIRVPVMVRKPKKLEEKSQI